MKHIRKTLLNHWPLFFVFIFTLVFFNKLFFPNISIFTTPGDIPYFNYPLKNFLSESLKNHQLPFWTNQIGTGFPVLADSPIGTFYLPNLILFYLFSTPIAFNLSNILVFLTSATGMYLLCKKYKLSAFPSLYAAFAFSFSGFFITRIIHTTFIQTVSFLPLLFYLAEMYLEKKRKIILLIISFLISQLIFAGYMQGVFYIIIFLVSYLFIRLRIQKIKIKLKFISFVLFLVAIIFSFLLSAIQILPTYELVQLSSRSSGLSFEELFTNSGSSKILSYFFDPFHYGNISKGTYTETQSLGIYWENIAYSGFLTPIFALLSLLLLRKNKLVFIFALSTLISLLLVLGKYSPTHIIFDFPPFNFFRIPARFLFITSFSISILSAIYLNSLSNNKKSFIRVLPFVITLIITVDIFYHWYSFHPVTNVENIKKKPESVQFFEEQNNFNQYRISSLWPFFSNTLIESNKTFNEINERYVKHFYKLSPNVNMLYDIPSVDFYTSLTPRRLRLIRDQYSQGFKVMPNLEINLDDTTIQLLKFQAVKYISSTDNFINKNIKLIKTDNINGFNYKIYELTNPYARIRLVRNTIKVNTMSDLTSNLFDSKIDFNSTAIVEKDVPKLAHSFTKYNISDLIDNQNSLSFNIDVDGEAYILMSDTYYPGWEAKIDDKRQEIIQANGYARLLYVDEGKHNVSLKYKPKSFRNGMLISISSHLILLILSVYLLKKNRVIR